MDTHVKVLAILHLVLSGCMALAAFTLMLIFGGASAIVGATAPAEDAVIALPIIGITGMALAAFLLALAVPGLLAGYGLLKRQNWARILTIIISAIQLLNIPVGTVLGIYGLWVLLSKDTERVFSPAA